MNKYILGFVLLLISGAVMAQRPGKSRVKLDDSEKVRIEKTKDGKEVYKTKKGVFRQDYSTLTADSSSFYIDDNLVDAYGNVVINQGDTLHIFSDKLHYDGNTKLATLTGNVKMVDKDATLLTDYFTYNTATKIGTYTGGGKLFNKENTLTSKNGYYFAGSRDAYFRYNVVLTTPDAIIKTDTLRYNSGSRISWFYGPTNIYGTKDKDVLYTENGRYETIPEQAFFGKRNLYTQGTKSLKGDSLFYDRLKGYGRAVKNVVFDDKEQRITVKGHLGEYYKATEQAIITQNPYVIFVTQDSSRNTQTTNKDSVNKTADSLALAKLKKDTVALNVVNNVITPTGQVAAANIKTTQPTLKAVTDSVMRAAQKNTQAPVNIPAPAQKVAKKVNDAISKEIKAVQPANNTPAIKSASQQSTATIIAAVKNEISEARKSAEKKVTALPKRDSIKILARDSLTKPAAGVDSMYLGADTIDTRVITFKQLKEMKMARYLLDNPDTAAKILPSIILTKANWPKVLSARGTRLTVDTNFTRPDFFSKKSKAAPKAAARPVPVPVADNVKPAPKTPLPAKDSLALNPNNLSDTSRIRIIMGYHGAKIFKSDLQAKADSLFYASSDSTIRMYVNPIIWTQGSQLTGDTIALQMKNRKLDNVDLFPNGFIANIEKNDSLHFNQAGGRRIHGTFKDSRLNTMEIDGNAETIYYNRDTVKNVVTEVLHSVSSSVKTRFKNGKLMRGTTYGASEYKANAPSKLKDDDKILKGFIWKPKERPASKEVITGAGKNPQVTAIKPPAGKNQGIIPAKKDDGKKPGITSRPAGADTTAKKDTPVAKPVTYDILISN